MLRSCFLLWQKLTRSLSLSLFLFLVSLPFTTTAHAFEQITHFNSEITINQDTSVSITETIKFTTTEDKHGIYRYVPIRYTREGLNYTALIHDIAVTDEQGKKIQYEESRSNGNVVLKIGDPDRTFTGDKTYIISYVVDNAVQQIKTYPTTVSNEPVLVPELYWDITGEGWQIDIASTSAQITSPYASINQAVACYSGTFGSNDGLCQVDVISGTTVQLTYPQTITYGENMTVALQLDPQGFLVFPTKTQLALKQLRDNWRLIPLLIPGLVMAAWWWKRGRDTVFVSWNVFNHDQSQPQTTAPLWNFRHTPMVYQPLTELTPGEAGALHDEKVDNQDIIAEIIDLARQKFLKIEQHDTSILFFKSTDYTFTQLKTTTAKLPEHQKYLLESLFKTGKTVKLSALKGSFYTHMEKVKQLIFRSLTNKELFVSNPDETRGVGFAAAIVMTILSAYWGINLLNLGMYWAIPCFVISTGLAFWAAYHLPSKSAYGSNLAWQVRGLKESIARGSWREKIKEKHLFFEEVLPFAIALGVVERLSKDMNQLNVKNPEYLSSTQMNGWSAASFVNTFTSEASSNLSYNPNSSSYGSGGSSGGSSGGGGGGGGGGSW